MKITKLYTIILVTMLIIGIATNVNAESLKYSATASTNELKEGESVTITLGVSDIDVNEDGIYTFGGKLIYDKEVFEEVKSENFSSQNNWSIAYNGEKTEKEGTFLATRMTGLKEKQTIGTITLKTKTNIKSTKTEIKLIEVSSVGEDTIKLENKVISLNVTGTKKDDSSEGNNGNGTNNNGNNGNVNGSNNGTQNGNTNGNTNANGNTNGNGAGSTTGNSGSNITIKNPTNTKDKTTSKNKIPQTGVNNIPIILVSIAILTTMVVSCIKYKRNIDVK